LTSANPVEHKTLISSLGNFGALIAITPNALGAEVRKKLTRFS
jgi:hypothetical protein